MDPPAFGLDYLRIVAQSEPHRQRADFTRHADVAEFSDGILGCEISRHFDRFGEIASEQLNVDGFSALPAERE